MNKTTVPVHMTESSWEEVQRALTDIILRCENASNQENTPDFARRVQERRSRTLKKVRNCIAKQI